MRVNEARRERWWNRRAMTNAGRARGGVSDRLRIVHPGLRPLYYALVRCIPVASALSIRLIVRLYFGCLPPFQTTRTGYSTIARRVGTEQG